MKWHLVKRCQVCSSTFLDSIDPDGSTPIAGVEREIVEADKLEKRDNLHRCTDGVVGIFEIVGAVKA